MALFDCFGKQGGWVKMKKGFCVNLGAKVLSISDENATTCHSDDRREEESRYHPL